MGYFACYDLETGRVLAVDVNEASSLISMSALAQSYKKVRRIHTDRGAYVDWSYGREMVVSAEVNEAGKITRKVERVA